MIIDPRGASDPDQSNVAASTGSGSAAAIFGLFASFVASGHSKATDNPFEHIMLCKSAMYQTDLPLELRDFQATGLFSCSFGG